MRILLANERRTGAGGVETYLGALVGVLASRGHEVALLHDHGSAQTGPTVIAAPSSWSLQDLGFDAAMSRAFDWQPDIVFSHNMPRLAIDEALTARAPVVKMMHGYFGTCVSGHKMFGDTLEPCTRTCGAACLVKYVPRRCGQRRPGAIVSQYRWAARQRALFPRYRRVVVASDYMRREYLRHDVAPDRVLSVPLFTTQSGPDALQKDVDILFLGRMTPLKGGEVLLQAVDVAARAVGRRLSVAMGGNGPSLERLRQMAARTAADVAFPGWADPKVRTDLLSRASVLAIPSRWPEPFGLVGLEAAAMSVPTVAFDVGGISEWLVHEVNGVMVPYGGGAAAFGAALARVLADASLRRRLGDGARKTSASFSADAHGAAIERVLEAARA